MILATNDFSLAFISNENLPTHIKYHGFADNRTFCELVLPWKSILSEGSYNLVIL